MNHETRQIVFVHTMWRSRSTWLFSRFRETGTFDCLYEPLNEQLAGLEAAVVDESDALEHRRTRMQLRHPDLVGGYWQEYEHRLAASGIGVDGFDEQFAFHPFDTQNDPAPYLRRLIARSTRERVLLQSTRSSLRIDFLVARFPDARHFFLERDAGDQFLSYGVNPRYFLPMHVSYAYLQPDLRWELMARFPALHVTTLRQRQLRDDVRRLRRFFQTRLDAMPESERRRVFDFLRATALDRASKANVEIVDVDDLAALRSAFGPFGLSFDDYCGSSRP